LPGLGEDWSVDDAPTFSAVIQMDRAKTFNSLYTPAMVPDSMSVMNLANGSLR